MLQDLRFSYRELRKKPGLAFTAIISLTLGIGATTAVFSVIYGLLANPYPYHAADRMVQLVVVNERGDDRWIGITGPQLKLLRQLKCFESAAASWGTWNLTTTDEDLPQDVPSSPTIGNAGSHFGVPALLGRTLIPSDAPDGQDPQPVVFLSYLFWQRHFNSDPTVIGRTPSARPQKLYDRWRHPSRFTWTMRMCIRRSKSPTIAEHHGTARSLDLKPGITHEAANAELQPLLEQFAKDTPTHFPKKFRVHVSGINERLWNIWAIPCSCYSGRSRFFCYRMRQRVDPAARPRHGPAARARRSQRDRGQPLANSTPTSCRSPGTIASLARWAASCWRMACSRCWCVGCRNSRFRTKW